MMGLGKKILITLGDPNGIGPEISYKALKYLSPIERAQIECVGPKIFETKYRDSFSDLIFHSVGADINCIPGFLDKSGGDFSILSLNKAICLLKNNSYKALVTAPISKKAVVLSGYKDFVGHTEYLGSSFESEVTSVFFSSSWSVVLVTSHIPLLSVFEKLSKEKLRKTLSVAINFHKEFYSKDDVIVVCGLNPHAGEGSILGNEEEMLIRPILEEFRNKGFNVEGPISPDIVFRDANLGKYKTIIALYHDQGLIPFKMLHFFSGVHITLGLPFMRVSPCHGVAWDIAGKNIADSLGMLNALKFVL